MSQNVLIYFLALATFQPLFRSQPIFDPSALFHEILVPADAPVGSIIYRLRASDPSFNYPLTFRLKHALALINLENLNCSRLNSICQANVILKKRLEVGRFYDFGIVVENKRGQFATLNCSLRATNATTPTAVIFPSAPTLVMVEETAKKNAELAVVVAKGNANRTNGVLLELWASKQFGLYQRFVGEKDAQGTVILLEPLDYEKSTVHHVTILANDPWTEIDKDTRNIAAWSFLVAVIDIQDTPPVFTQAPPTTVLTPTLRPGDTILTVHAEDGDRGNPRAIRYNLNFENKLYASFFNISEDTGELRLLRPITDILSVSVRSRDPIIVNVEAEEVRVNVDEPPALTASVRMALIPPEVKLGKATFTRDEYVTYIDENTRPGAILNLTDAEILTQPGDIVILGLSADNGTFDISPSVVKEHSSFDVRVRDSKFLDYETWHSVKCLIVASEVPPGNFTTTAILRVFLNDINDNYPQFSKSEYQASVAEGSDVGTFVVKLEAHDVDSVGNEIRYKIPPKQVSDWFELDQVTGVVTVSNFRQLDAEDTPIIQLAVEASDEEGFGLTSSAILTVTVIDVNDEPPQFDKKLYEFILNEDRSDFTTEAYLLATDRDLTSPNNVVKYELVNPVDGLSLDQNTGQLRLTQKWTQNSIVLTRARAWDGGVPRLFGECEIRIYSADKEGPKRMFFIVPGRHLDLGAVTRSLEALTGSRIVVEEVRPYSGDLPGATDISGSHGDRSLVVASIRSPNEPIIDINKLDTTFQKDTTTVIRQTERATVGGNIMWLLILLILFAILTGLILILCCICQGCPLYVPPKQTVIKPIKLQETVEVLPESTRPADSVRSKSVQVAEWFGRREKWTSEPVLNESIQKNYVEVERQSVGAEARYHDFEAMPRDHLYIREGNTDILKLITRGEHQQPSTSLMAEHQSYLNGSGKDILMSRFISQQEGIYKPNVTLPNAIPSMESLAIENSLRQQNILLRQILLDREREMRLETQSLPAGTQTDRDAETQTDLILLRPPRRKVRSDNDDNSDEDELYGTERRKKRSRRYTRHLKTPILEESEIENVTRSQSERDSLVSVKQTKTSALRQSRALGHVKSTQSSMNDLPKELERDSLEEDGDIAATNQRPESKVARKNDKVKKKSGGSRYMEWYKKNNKVSDQKSVKLAKEVVVVNGTGGKKELSSKSNGVGDLGNVLGPEHPLLQHSEHRFEADYPKKDELQARRMPMAQKQSVFTIAYNDIHKDKMRQSSASP